MKPAEVVQRILQKRSLKSVKKYGEGLAPTNIALIKYWGKRNEVLRTPTNSSLSIALPNKFTRTKISFSIKDADVVQLNGEVLDASSAFAKRLSAYLDFYRANNKIFFEVITEVNFPIAAGLASSASGFAALSLALNDFFGWQLSKKELSILARLGSGSACRSLWPGFVQWHVGVRADGMDSYAEPLKTQWPELKVGIIICDSAEKKINSSSAMQQTMNTSPYFKNWCMQSEKDLKTIKSAIKAKDFTMLGEIAEANAMMMHASCLAARPAILYWQPATLSMIKAIYRVRKKGVPLYFTIDAGANLVLLFLASEQARVQKEFSNLVV